jgi:transposase
MSITLIGLDTAKSVFQVHGIDGTGKAVIRRRPMTPRPSAAK